MCTKGGTCLCHLIKGVIEADKKKTIKKKYFDSTQCSELYEFLHLSYSLLKRSDFNHNDASFSKLNNLYIFSKAPKRVNISSEEYNVYMEVLTRFALEDKFIVKEWQQALQRLVKLMEKLVSANARHSWGVRGHEFIDVLQASAENSARGMNVSEKTPTCSIFQFCTSAFSRS